MPTDEQLLQQARGLFHTANLLRQALGALHNAGRVDLDDMRLTVRLPGRPEQISGIDLLDFADKMLGDWREFRAAQKEVSDD